MCTHNHIHSYARVLCSTVLHMVRGFQPDEYAPDEGVGETTAAQLRQIPGFAGTAAAEDEARQMDAALPAQQYQAPSCKVLTSQVRDGSRARSCARALVMHVRMHVLMCSACTHTCTRNARTRTLMCSTRTLICTHARTHTYEHTRRCWQGASRAWSTMRTARTSCWGRRAWPNAPPAAASKCGLRCCTTCGHPSARSPRTDAVRAGARPR